MEHNPARLYKGPLGVALEPAVRLLRGHGLAARYRFVWKTHRAVWRATRSNRVLIAGHDLLLDRGDALALASGRYEPDETAWYERHVGPGELVVEIGANIGFFSLILARAVGPDGRVISYEPDPDLNAILRRNAAENGYANIDVREAAAADKSGTMTFYRAPKNTGDNRLFTHGEDGEVFPVRVVRIDEDLADLKDRIDLLKMDIQGAEPLALAGMEDIFRDRPPRRMLIEFWPHGIIGMGNDPRAMIDLIRDAGFRITTMADGLELDIDAALRDMTVDNERWVNLVCTHESYEESR